jgi:hypothetical protein
VTYEQLQKRAEEQRRRQHQSKQQHIRRELIKRLSLAKQPVKAAAVCAKPLVRTAVSAARRLPLCCGARVGYLAIFGTQCILVTSILIAWALCAHLQKWTIASRFVRLLA